MESLLNFLASKSKNKMVNLLPSQQQITNSFSYNFNDPIMQLEQLFLRIISVLWLFVSRTNVQKIFWKIFHDQLPNRFISLFFKFRSTNSRLKYRIAKQSKLSIIIYLSFLNCDGLLIQEVQWFYWTQELLVPVEKFTVRMPTRTGNPWITNPVL